MATNPTQYAHPEALVETDWLEQHLKDDGIRVVESNEDVLLYDTGHIPGAVHIEWKRNLNPDGTFKSVDALRAMYTEAGVTNDREVVTYCQGGYRAAHAYVALRLLGHPDVRNYTGSWKEWGDREEVPVENTAHRRPNRP